MRLFASLRELAGQQEVEVEGASVEDVLSALVEKFGPRFEEIARAGSVVVQGERASWDAALRGDEEVALLPPVSGGASGETTVRPRPQRVLLVANPVARTVSRDTGTRPTQTRPSSGTIRAATASSSASRSSGRRETTSVTSPRRNCAQTRWSIQPPSWRGAPTPSSSIMAGMIDAGRYGLMTKA